MKIGRLARTGVPGLWALYCPVNLGVTYSYTLQTPLPGSPIGLVSVYCTGTYALTIMLCVHARSANLHAGARSALPILF